jgi:hypothetical protein
MEIALMYAMFKEETQEDRIAELLEAFEQWNAQEVFNWMWFSDRMVDYAERMTLEEYDNWRIGVGKVGLISRFKRIGKASLIDSLKVQRQVDCEAFKRWYSVGENASLFGKCVR